MAEVRRLLSDLGVPEAQIRTEAFASAPAAPVEIAADAQAASLPQLGAPASEAAGIASHVVSFQRSLATVEAPVGGTLLEAAEEAGVDLPFECRAGVCGQCKIKLLTGRVAMETQDALSEADRSRGFILACQARPFSDIAVDA